MRARLQDSVGHNALLEAVKRGHDPLIRLLIDNGSKCGPPGFHFGQGLLYTLAVSWCQP